MNAMDVTWRLNVRYNTIHTYTESAEFPAEEHGLKKHTEGACFHDCALVKSNINQDQNKQRKREVDTEKCSFNSGKKPISD